jgi:hypothetical protein
MKVEPTVDNIKNFRNNITLKNYENVDLDAIIYILDEVNNIVAATTGATEEQQEEFLLIVENFEETFGEQTIGRRNSGGYGGGVQTGAELIGQWKLNNSEQWF